jgi:ubiquinone/menaquinone biosynthesis C-methylase UbiE
MSRLFAMAYDRILAGSEEACVRDWRSSLLGGLRGTVVEIGAGTGLNLPHYPRSVDRLVLTEPDPHMRDRLRTRLAEIGGDAPRAEVVDAPAEELPLGTASADAVVSTLVLCSVPDQASALAEVRRVLKPGGSFVFLEHVHAPEKPRRARWQRRISPAWGRLFGGCRLDRETADAIEAAGLQHADVTRESMRKAVPLVRTTVRGHAVLPH